MYVGVAVLGVGAVYAHESGHPVLRHAADASSTQHSRQGHLRRIHARALEVLNAVKRRVGSDHRGGGQRGD